MPAKKEKNIVTIDWLAGRMRMGVDETTILAKKYGAFVSPKNMRKSADLDIFIERAVRDPDVIVPRTLTHCPKCKYRTTVTSGNSNDIGCYRAAIVHETNLTRDGRDRRGDDPEKCLKFEEGNNLRASDNKLGDWW